MHPEPTNMSRLDNTILALLNNTSVTMSTLCKEGTTRTERTQVARTLLDLHRIGFVRRETDLHGRRIYAAIQGSYAIVGPSQQFCVHCLPIQTVARYAGIQGLMCSLHFSMFGYRVDFGYAQMLCYRDLNTGLLTLHDLTLPEESDPKVD